MGVFTRSRAARILGGIALVGAGALVLAGCSGSSSPESSGSADAGFEFPIDCNAAEPAAYTPTYNSTSTGPGTDLTYKIGTALPVTGNLAFLGPPEIAGTEYAASEVNAAAKGVTVDLIQGDSGDTDNKAYETEIPRLLGEGATAIIGAASSGTSLQFIDQVIAANAIQFSPANTSAAFTGYEDNGLYWRTAPSDVLQGEVLGNLVAEDGHKNIGIIYQNDAYGTGLHDVVKEVFESTGGSVVAEASYNDGDSSFDAQVATIAAAQPDAVVLITFDQFATIAPLLVNAGVEAKNFYLVDGNLKQWGTDVSVSLEGAKGTTPGPVLEDDFKERLNAAWTAAGNTELDDYSYAAESYDAVVLLALASLASKSTTGADIATKLQEVSGGSGDGTKCTSFAECADIILEGGVADYDGYSGPVTFDENGDPTQASIGIFQYGADNTHTRVDTR